MLKKNLKKWNLIINTKTRPTQKKKIQIRQKFKELKNKKLLIINELLQD